VLCCILFLSKLCAVVTSPDTTKAFIGLAPRLSASWLVPVLPTTLNCAGWLVDVVGSFGEAGGVVPPALNLVFAIVFI
jgi:hypothetical protein